MIMFRRIKGMRGRKMGREIGVRCGIWRSLWGWYRRSDSFGKDFVKVF